MEKTIMGEHFDNLDSIEKTAEKLYLLSMAGIVWFKQMFLSLCPNKRVVHLAKHGSKKTSKKNFHRAIRILEER